MSKPRDMTNETSIKIFTSKLLSIALCLALAWSCGKSSTPLATPPVAAYTSDSLYDSLTKVNSAAYAKSQAAIGQLSMPAYFALLKASVNDTPFSLDGHLISGQRTRLEGDAAIYAKFADHFASVDQLWTKFAIPTTLMPKATFEARIASAIGITPPPSALGLVMTRAQSKRTYTMKPVSGVVNGIDCEEYWGMIEDYLQLTRDQIAQKHLYKGRMNSFDMSVPEKDKLWVETANTADKGAIPVVSASFSPFLAQVPVDKAVPSDILNNSLEAVLDQ